MRALAPTILLLVLAATAGHADVVTESRGNLEAMTTALARDKALDLDGEQVVAVIAVSEFYAGNGHAPAWTDPATVTRMLAAIEDMRGDGLDPGDYHATALAALGADLPADPEDLARRDVLLTDAYFLMIYHLRFGKADPNRIDEDWNYDDLYETLDVADADTRSKFTAMVLEVVAEGDFQELLDRARPALPLYGQMRDGYGFYADLAAAGGWPIVSDGPTLREGDDDPRVADLRTRLAMTGDLPVAEKEGTVFDADLAAAVTGFQTRHGLDTDGAVGPRTLAALNVSAAERADQIRVNLERARWVMNHDAGGNFILVNICAYKTALYRDMEPVWVARVQVGKPFTKSPIFAGSMTYLDFNPTWTVPASIANRSILPKVKKDPDYLAKSNMALLDNSGNEVSPATVDWGKVTRMPYTVRQAPGPNNALGQVKFIFPNKHAVYLHDTPSRHKFDHTKRAFSSGCIRVENPMELAALLLDDQDGWTPRRIDEVLESGKRTTARLTEPLPVFLLYWTAFPGNDDRMDFREDLYDRDAPVLQALQGPIQMRQSHAPR